MRLYYLLLFLLLISCSPLTKKGLLKNEEFLVDNSGKHILCADPNFPNWYYFTVFDDSNNIIRNEHLFRRNDTLYFSNKAEVFSADFNKYIAENNFTAAKQVNNIDKLAIESSVKILAPIIAKHEMLGDSILSFESVFSVRSNQKTLINDTFHYNYLYLIPVHNKLVDITAFKQGDKTFLFVRHTWSVEEKYDSYTKYKDYIVALP